MTTASLTLTLCTSFINFFFCVLRALFSELSWATLLLQSFRFPKKMCGKQNRSFQSKCFLEFRWLHYNEQNDFVFCFICVQENATLNVRVARKKLLAFISEGFSNWKKTDSI